MGRDRQVHEKVNGKGKYKRLQLEWRVCPECVSVCAVGRVTKSFPALLALETLITHVLI